jgi:hypothetical protein
MTDNMYPCITAQQDENPQTEKDCIVFVSRDGLLLRFVRNQTDAIRLAAVQQNGMAIQFVPWMDQSDAINLVAVQQNGMALQFICNQKPIIFITACHQNELALQFVGVFKLTPITRKELVECHERLHGCNVQQAL